MCRLLLRKLLLSICLGAALTPQMAPAISFGITLDTANTLQPTFDPDGAILQEMMILAAQHWSGIIKDNHHIDINVLYADIPTASALVVTQANDRTLTGEIKFSFDRNWYIDPSPTDNKEFLIVPTLYRDLSPFSQASDFSTNNPETLLEIGYRGNTNGTDPAAANGFDYYSTALHEIGHLLGVTSNLSAALTETADGDYDLPTDLLGGKQMGVATITADEPEHMANAFSLMSGVGTNTGVRRLPSAADVLSMAAVSGWTQIDLPRKDFVGTPGNWNSAPDWIGKRVPSNTDEAYVRNGSRAELTADGAARTLLVGDSATLDVGRNVLEVTESVQIGSPGVGTVIVGDGSFGAARLHAADLEINALSELHLKGLNTTVHVENDLTISLGTLSGHGVVEVGGGLDNLGTIIAESDTPNRQLTLRALNQATLDLDGSLQQGVVQVLTSDLVVESPLTDHFDGTLTLGDGRRLWIKHAWTHKGMMAVDPGPQGAVVRGRRVDIHGTVDIPTDASLRLEAPAVLQGTSVITVDGDLEIRSQVDALGPTITGEGRLTQGGALDVQATTTLEVDTHFQAGSLTHISPNTRLRLEAGGTISRDAGFQGSGVLTNPTGSELTLEHQATVLVRIDNSGTMAIGDSPGRARVGAYVQRPVGSLQIEIGGHTPGSEHDRLNIVGDGILSGTLGVSFIDAGNGLFVPAAGDSFEILSLGTRSGQFTRTLLPFLGKGLTWDVVYGDTFVRLDVLGGGAPASADFDQDGDVDDDDFAAWQDNFGTTSGAVLADGDANSDGDVDGGDFLDWQQHTGSNAVLANASVPEPGAFALAMLSLTMLLHLRRRSSAVLQLN